MPIESFVSKDGTRIGCHTSGAGSPLVLIHGGTADHARWAPVLPAFEKQFTVYACDRRGRGASGDQADYAIEREVEDVVAIIDGIGGPVDVVAHSYGALVTMEAAAKAKNLRRLVLYEPPLRTTSLIYPPGLVERLEAKLAASDREGVLTTFFTEVVQVPPAQLQVMQKLPAWSARVAAAHTIVREVRAHQSYTFSPYRLRGVTTPTLLLLGGASPAYFGEGIAAVHEAIQSSRVVVLPGQQHIAIDTATDLFVREVLSFLTPVA
jgi:pimeloyl-ACP methyl ester carboxylesterase